MTASPATAEHERARKCIDGISLRALGTLPL
jgi:hypothetical protein